VESVRDSNVEIRERNIRYGVAVFLMHGLTNGDATGLSHKRIAYLDLRI